MYSSFNGINSCPVYNGETPNPSTTFPDLTAKASILLIVDNVK